MYAVFRKIIETWPACHFPVDWFFVRLDLAGVSIPRAFRYSAIGMVAIPERYNRIISRTVLASGSWTTRWPSSPIRYPNGGAPATHFPALAPLSFPNWVRSRMVSRSKAAMLANMVIKNLPVLVPVSKLSVIDISGTWCFSR
ncbi:MAG: hypothetical protein JL56_05930 [Desulfotomaculum sp. BICA1-6]|nr:MAG: hypothetical protein JL56_05930 [Desulfotomaculum sp. BICA1-6]